MVILLFKLTLASVSACFAVVALPYLSVRMFCSLSVSVGVPVFLFVWPVCPSARLLSLLACVTVSVLALLPVSVPPGQ
jgi:hypothetical protein